MDNQNFGSQIPPVEPKAQSASPLNKRLIIGLSAGIVILLAAVIYLFTAKQAVSPVVDNNQQTKNQEPAEDNNQTATTDWKTYTSNSFGFSIKYPEGYEPTMELNDQHNKLTVFGGDRADFFEVRIIKDQDKDMSVKYGYLGAQIETQDISLSNVKGYKAVSETGYGDAGFQGAPFVEFAVRRNDEVYHLNFYGDAVISEQENNILSAFKFTN